MTPYVFLTGNGNVKVRCPNRVGATSDFEGFCKLCEGCEVSLKTVEEMRSIAVPWNEHTEASKIADLADESKRGNYVKEHIEYLRYQLGLVKREADGERCLGLRMHRDLVRSGKFVEAQLSIERELQNMGDHEYAKMWYSWKMDILYAPTIADAIVVSNRGVFTQLRSTAIDAVQKDALDPLKLAKYGELFEEEDKGYLWWNTGIEGHESQRAYGSELMRDMHNYGSDVVYEVFRRVGESDVKELAGTERAVTLEGIALDSLESFTKAVKAFAADNLCDAGSSTGLVTVGSKECDECASKIGQGEIVSCRRFVEMGIQCNESFVGDNVTVGSDECRSCAVQLAGVGETCRKRLKDIEPDTSSWEEDRHAGTKGTTVGRVEAGLSRVKEAKENIRRFFREHPAMEPDDLALIGPVIEVFGWIYPTDCVIACANVLRAANRIPLELQERLKESWNALKFSGSEGEVEKK